MRKGPAHATGRDGEYDPDHDHVAGGIPGPVVTEVERPAGQLVDLAGMGIDVSDMGDGPEQAAYAVWMPPAAGSTSWWRRGTR